MEHYKTIKHSGYKYTIYLDESKSKNIEDWLREKEEVLHVVNGGKYIMVDFTPRCSESDIENIITAVGKQLKTI